MNVIKAVQRLQDFRPPFLILRCVNDSPGCGSAYEEDKFSTRQQTVSRDQDIQSLSPIKRAKKKQNKRVFFNLHFLPRQCARHRLSLIRPEPNNIYESRNPIVACKNISEMLILHDERMREITKQPIINKKTPPNKWRRVWNTGPL